MKLTIQQNIPHSVVGDLTVSFAKLLADADIAGLSEMLSDDVFIVIFRRKTIYGLDEVLEYFRDWLARVGDTFECEVKWSAQYSRPEIYFTFEKLNLAYILGFENDKVARILLIPQSFSSIGFSIDENPYQFGFIEANAPKETEPLHNHAFCPLCGRTSESLMWKNGIFFKEDSSWNKKTGIFVNASVCPACYVVCEASPDRTANRILTMTREQRKLADESMTEEERARYVGNSIGNKRPFFKVMLKPRTNELSRFGQSFHRLLHEIVKGKPAGAVFDLLDKLTSPDRSLKLLVASQQTYNTSFFYIEDGNELDDDIFGHIKAAPSIEAAWQIYLLHNAPTIMPIYWHGGYILRDHIFDEAQLNHYVPIECHDPSGLSRENLLLPEVTLSPDGRTADVYCTYWNNWKGLVRDHLQITFFRNGMVRLTEIEPLILFEYNCGIRF